MAFATELDMKPAPDREFGAGMVQIDHEKCHGCTLCAFICPSTFLVIVGKGKDKKSHVIDRESNCMACGCCVAICETGAITLTQPYDFGGKWKQFDRGEVSLPRKF